MKLAGSVRDAARMDTKQSAFMRGPEVIRVLGVARSTLWRWCKAGTFPRPVKLAERAVAWRRSDVERWIEDRPEV